MSGRAHRQVRRMLGTLGKNPSQPKKDLAGGADRGMLAPHPEPRIPRTAVTLITVEAPSPADPPAAPPDADTPVSNSCGDGGWGKGPFLITSFRY